MREEVLEDAVELYMPAKAYAEQWETEELKNYVSEIFNLDLPIVEWADEDGVDNEVIRDRISNAADEFMDGKNKSFGPENMSSICKQILLQTIDRKWREHLLKLEHLRSVVSFRGYAQRDPLNEYKNEAFQLFESLLGSLRLDVTKHMGKVRPLTEEEQKAIVRQMASNQEQNQKKMEQPKTNGLAINHNTEKVMPINWQNTGRNEKCPCGSGKKFKHCHGRYV
jgi:Preprotein translocase subunit SecA (ATPase, RNA helicase)